MSTRGITPKQAAFAGDAARFAKHLDRSGGASACWVWLGATDPKGYGRFHVSRGRGSSALAHRVAFEMAHGYLPVVVCHRCDNPPCCNPAHLFGGTRADNNRDMSSKGRHWLQVNPSRAVRGAEHGHAKLTDAAVRAIRAEYSTNGTPQRKIAQDFGVSQRTISKVVNVIGWRHV